MGAKEKAKYLYDLFFDHAYHPNKIWNTKDEGGHTKAICIKCVKEIQKSGIVNNEYWDSVINEIGKL